MEAYPMTKRTPKQWQQIMDAHAQFAGTTKEFCQQRNIHTQTFYSRRHAMGLASPMQTNKDALPKPLNTPVSAPTGQFIKAQVRPVTSAMVLHTPHAQLSLSTQCDPIWLATLLKELAV
tara:strand:+ start:42 stop:398 length:357 start_codon:yes stop_codon:yes gene_type:complete